MMRVAVVMLVLAIGASEAWAQDTWRSLRGRYSNTAAGFNHGVAAVGGYLYSFGGSSWYGLFGVEDTYRYDPSTNRWTRVADMPYRMEGFASAVHDGRIYAIGAGYDIYDYSGATRTQVIQFYDPGTDTWDLKSVALSGDLSYPTACVLNGRIYICSGESKRFEEYDPAQERITAKAVPPFEEQGGMTAATNGRVYFFGGATLASGVSTKTWSWNPATDVWTRHADMPDGRYMAGTFVLNSRIYCVGGYLDPYNFGTNSTFEYEPGSDTWTLRTPYPNARLQLGGAVIGNKGYAQGGQPYNTLSPCDEYTPPDFGSPPNLPTVAVQLNQNGDIVPAGGWVGADVTFEVTVDDPAPGDQLRLEIEVKRAGDPWTGVPTDRGTLGPQGTIRTTLQFPTTAEYDWRYRVADQHNNYTPGLPDWIDFDAGSPDFRIDLDPPTTTSGIAPLGRVISADGQVTFRWNASTDNATTVDYELEVGYNPAFSVGMIAAQRVPATELALGMPLQFKQVMYWRVRAVDQAGNASPWSPIYQFYFKDPVDHAAGDAQRVCGFSAIPGSGPAVLLLLALATIAAGRRRAK